jgi:hypothetical protein
MRKLAVIGLVVALMALVVFTVNAQTDSETTPTPAPSKTATQGAPQQAAATPSALETVEAGEFETLTQADLQILTGNVQRPNGIAWFNDNLYTACTGDSTVYEINSRTGATRTYIFGIVNAQTLYVEEDENQTLTMFVPDYANNTLTRVTRQGVTNLVHDLEGPWGISYVDEERFFVTSLLGNRVNLINREGESQPVLEGLSSPMGIVHDGETVFVANYGSTRRSVEFYSFDSVVNGAQDDEENHVLVSGLQNTTGLQLGADGLLYFAYSLGNRGLVGRVDPAVCAANGGCTNDQIEIVLYTDLAVPLAGLTLTPDMRIFVHTMFTPDIYWAQL